MNQTTLDNIRSIFFRGTILTALEFSYSRDSNCIILQNQSTKTDYRILIYLKVDTIYIEWGKQ